MGWCHSGGVVSTRVEIKIALTAHTYYNYNHNYDQRYNQSFETPSYSYESLKDCGVPFGYRGDEYQFSQPHKTAARKNLIHCQDSEQQSQKTLITRHAEQLLLKQQKLRKQARRKSR